MRFFTPDLYVRFNSSDEDEADRANEAWEEALSGYRKHLDSIRDQMPSQVRKLSELNLHDSELLACDQVVEPYFPPHLEPFGPLWSALAIVSVKNAGQIESLIYVPWDRLREQESPKDWPFSKRRTHWLYDEVDTVSGRGLFVHRILLSDGRVLEIPFLSVFIHSLSLSSSAEGVEVRRIA